MKAHLVDVAARILDEEGAGALTMRHLAEVAGTTTTPVYSRFGSKNGILDLLYIRGFRTLVERIASTPLTSDAVRDMLAAGLQYWRFAQENPALYDLMFEGGDSDHQPSAAAYGEAFRALDQLSGFIRRVIDSGAMPEQDVHRAATMVWATAHGVVTLTARNPLPDLSPQDDLFMATLTTLVRGMCDTRPDGQ